MLELEAHVSAWSGCDACPLHRSAQQHVCYRGIGSRLDVLFVGEAPGNSEDVIGEPFVGPAGKLLDKLVATVNLELPVVFRCGFTNVVACAPWEDGKGESRKVRPPNKEEAKACRPRLQELIEIVKPKAIVLVGASATKYLSWCKLPKASIKHPAAMLRKENYLSDFNEAVTTIRMLLQKADHERQTKLGSSQQRTKSNPTRTGKPQRPVADF